ncbi:MAG TPA: hypothetical protein PK522_00950 [Nitrosomonas sp.]|nr:hypothetical protein [Nitrosomonas sp.]
MKKMTMIILGIVFVCLVLWDVYAMVKSGGSEASISSVIINFAYKMPMFSFSSGFVCGHLFWRMRTNKDTKHIDDQGE